MFESKFKELMKESKTFEVIKDTEALAVEGGGGCKALTSCGQFDGSCSNLSHCDIYSTQLF